jgi:ATP-dependent Clp protease, protease subunit
MAATPIRPATSVASASPEKNVRADIDLKMARLRLEEQALRVKALRRTDRKESTTLDTQRVYPFAKEVNEESVSAAISWLTQKAAESKDPITIRLTTPGGSVVHGLALYDTIKQIEAQGIEVNIVGIGYVASMGTILMQAATHREMTENASFMVHEISSALPKEKLFAMEDSVEYDKKLWARLANILAARSTFKDGVAVRRWNAHHDKWLSADEALKLGFIDKVV